MLVMGNVILYATWQWFWIDLVSALPFEVLIPPDDTGEKSLSSKLFPLVKTVRLLRLGKITRFFATAGQDVLAVLASTLSSPPNSAP